VVVEDVKAKTLKEIIRNEVEGTAHIMTDQMASYHGLGREFASLGTVDHRAKEYVRGVIHINFSESYFSLFKRGIIGAFHHISRKHIQRHLEEFDFRWNHRKVSDSERMMEAVAGPRASGCSTARQSGW
jgi:transposase-like protein